MWYTPFAEVLKSPTDQGKQVYHVKWYTFRYPLGVYRLAAAAGSQLWRFPAGRSEELPEPRPGGRAAHAARGGVLEHEKPAAPWGIRPRSRCFSFQTARSRRVAVASGSRARPLRAPLGYHPGPLSDHESAFSRLVAKDYSDGIES